MTTNDRATYPVGDYVFDFTATIGAKSAPITITVQFVDPCATATFTILQNPFVGPYPVIIDSSEYSIAYNPGYLVYSSATVDCGVQVLEFSLSNGDPLDSAIFSETRSDPITHYLNLGFVDKNDWEKAGDYIVRWKIYYEDYPSRQIVSPDFIVQVIDPCNPHVPAA